MDNKKVIKIVNVLIAIALVTLVCCVFIINKNKNEKIEKLESLLNSAGISYSSDMKNNDNENKKMNLLKSITNTMSDEEAESKADIEEYYLYQKERIKKIVNDTAKIDLYDDDISWASWFETEQESTKILKNNESVEAYKITNYDSVKNRFTEEGFKNLIEQYETMIIEYNGEHYMYLDGMGGIPTYVTHKLIYTTSTEEEIKLVDVLLYDESYDDWKTVLENEITTSTKFTTVNNDLILVKVNDEWKIDKYTVIW